MGKIKKLGRYLLDQNFRFAVDTSHKMPWVKNVSDKDALRMLYKNAMGKDLNLDNPQTFNEKLQWLKLYDRNPLYTRMVDKYEAKKYVAEIIGEEYIIPTYGVWEHFDEIDFDSLPNQFVLKCTHDSGGIVICRDKAKLDYQEAKRKIERCLKRDFFLCTREWPYKDVPRRIIAEQYMEDETDNIGLTDYKFFCFNGEPRMLYISIGLEDHSTAQISFYDLAGKEMPFCRSDYRPIKNDIELPENYNTLLSVAKRLSEAINSPFVRIDLYPIKNKVYFSEITFYPCSGMLPFCPEEWDSNIGAWITLPQNGHLIQ